MRARWLICAALIAACHGSDVTTADEAPNGPVPLHETQTPHAEVAAGYGSGAASGSAAVYAPKQAVTKTAAPVPSGGAARVGDTLARLDATVGHKLIRHGDLRITVESVDGARVKLEELADENGGFIDRSQIDHEDGKASRATIVLRIPAERFMDVMRGSRGLGQVDRDEAETEDVTQEYTDLAARLA
ncbi:MAG TPA: DUF4349 domain-containing protein, partial [Kofleriaceae bacterium]|nr:DUF4349 domain-containing protein [Kofleriaceae bacterium]